MEQGLEKKLSIVNVWALAFGCIIGWGCFVLPGTMFLKQAGVWGTMIAIAIAAIVMIIIAINYDYMINRYPVAGGEFTYTKNTFGRNHAYICAWFLALSYATLVPMNATALALIARYVLNDVFQVGFHYIIAGYDIYLGEIILAVVAIILFGWFSIRGVKFIGILQVILTFMLVGGVLTLLIATLVRCPEAGNAFSVEDAPISWKGILAVLAVAPFLFVGFDTVPQSAEEYNFSPRKTIYIMIFSIVFGGLVYIVVNTFTAIAIPAEYGNWVEYIDDLANLNDLKALPTFSAANVLLGRLGVRIVSAAVIGAVLSGIAGFYMATSRLLYAMANDSYIPQWFGRLDEKYRTPKNSILFMMVLSVIAPFFGRTALGWLVDMSSLGAAIGYGYTSAAVFKNAKRNGSVLYVMTGAIGSFFAVIFTVLLLIPIPGLSCSLGKEAYICLLIWIVLGLFFRKKAGDIQ